MHVRRCARAWFHSSCNCPNKNNFINRVFKKVPVPQNVRLEFHTIFWALESPHAALGDQLTSPKRDGVWRVRHDRVYLQLSCQAFCLGISECGSYIVQQVHFVSDGVPLPSFPHAVAPTVLHLSRLDYESPQYIRCQECEHKYRRLSQTCCSRRSDICSGPLVWKRGILVLIGIFHTDDQGFHASSRLFRRYVVRSADYLFRRHAIFLLSL